MSHIVKVDAHVLEATLDVAWDFGIEPFKVATCVVVEVETDDGIRGFGEAIARKSPRTTATIVTDMLRSIALGRQVAELGEIWHEATTGLRRWGHSRGFLLEALSGLDVALWDAHARELGIPIGTLLPFRSRPQVDTYASSIYFKPTVQDAVAYAEDLVDAGHTRIKVKIGHRPDQGGLRRDIDTVRAIIAAVGDGIEIMLDANGTYAAAEARVLVDALQGAGVRWLEEPVPPDDLGGYTEIARFSPIPLATGETEFSVFGFRDLFQERRIAFAQPDIARCGGFTGAIQIASLCYAHNVRLCPHTGFSGGLNNLASLHLAAMAPDDGLLEHMVISNPLRDIFQTALPEPKGGTIAVPAGPGLGMEIDDEALQRFRVGV